MALALKHPRLDVKLPPRPRLPKLPDPSEPDVFEEMTILEHLTELRDRLIKAILAVVVAFVGGLALAQPMMVKLKEEANARSGFLIISPTDTVTLFFKVALYIAIGIALPVILWEFFGFLAPGLTRREKRVLVSSLPFVTVLFVTGAAYAFFVAAPRAFQFLSTFESGLYLWYPTGEETVSFYLTLMFGLALAFQLPLIMFLLAKLNLVTPRKMRNFRKYAILLISIAAAVITPSTDPFNMGLVAIPLWALYELGILSSYPFARRPAAAAA